MPERPLPLSSHARRVRVAGGGTRFTALNVTVRPKRGRALIWPSVYDDDPTAKDRYSDPRTHHEALPVKRGTKFSANLWIHAYDFQRPKAAGCTNEQKMEGA